MLRLGFILILSLLGCKGWANDRECLALAIYYESRSESMLGQIAVGQTVINRVESKHFPNTVCDVVYQARTYKNGKIVLHGCQFSFYCDGKPENVNRESKQWRMALEYASIVLSGRIVFDITEGAEFYHAYYVRPS